MTDFNTLIKQQAELCVNLLGGVDAAYVQGALTIPSLSVIIDSDIEFYDEYGQVAGTHSTASITNAELTVKPIYGATITTSSRTWNVERVVSDDGAMTVISIT